MTAGKKYSEHEIFADKANDYLDKHGIYELFASMMRDLAMTQPEEPLARMLTLLDRPAETLRVLIFGAPGSGADERAAEVAEKFGLVTVVVEDLLKAEVNNKTAFGAKVKDCRDNDEPVSDELVTSIIKTRLSKSDVANKGWILDGWPKTARQVSSLQQAGILANRVVVIDADTQKCKAAAQASGAYSDISSEAFHNLYSDYERNLKAMVSLFPQQPHNYTIVSAKTSGPAAQAEQIAAFCKRKKPSPAPRRPMRVLMLGPTGAGKYTQSVRLANKHGLVHLSSGALLRAEMAKSAELTNEMEPYLKAGQLVPESVIIPIVTNRLLASDCRQRGWILDGFPRTAAQAEALAKNNLTANRVVFLEVSEETSKERCLRRRVDPTTGEVYDADNLNEAPADLTTLAKDTQAVLSNLISNYEAGKEAVGGMYKGVSATIDGSDDERTVSGNIETFLNASLGATSFGEEKL